MPRMSKHSVDTLRAAVCRHHGGFEKATEQQLRRHYQALDARARKRIDDTAAEILAGEPPAPAEAPDDPPKTSKKKTAGKGGGKKTKPKE